MRTRKRFGESLVEAGVITEQSLISALQAQKKSGLALGRILEDMGTISDWDIVVVLGEQFNLRVLQTIPAKNLTEPLQRIIDCDTAIRKTVFPLELKDGLLRLAISNPLDFDTQEKIAFQTGLRIEPVLATPTEIFRAIKRCYVKTESTSNTSLDKVLIVDEQDLYRGTICSNLRKAGFQPFFSSSILEATKLALRDSPHLILLSTTGNMVYTKMQVERLQNNPTTENRPLMALSAYGTPEEEAALLGMGFFDIAFKPLNYTRLLARMERALRFFYHERIPHS